MQKQDPYSRIKPARLQIVKLVIYGTLVASFGYFLVEDWLASDHTYRDGITLANVTDAFASSADSFAWLILLAIFELETWQLDDRRLTRSVTLGLTAVSAVAYIMIVLAFLGYYEQLSLVAGFDKTPQDICVRSEAGSLSIAVGPDNYRPLSPAACHQLTLDTMLYHAGRGLVADPITWDFMKRMAWTDVINALSWLVLVVVLKIDVWLELTRSRSKRLLRLSHGGKTVLYGVLIGCCLYWFWCAQIVDAVDALFWLLAFFLIELNILAWQGEMAQNQKERTTVD